jgi:hypothetical protein
LGACRALERDDRDAIAHWQQALAAGMPPSVVTPLIIDAYIRLGESARASEVAQPLTRNGVPDDAVLKGMAAIHVAQGRAADAIPLLERYLSAHTDDQDARYVLLHALFATHVGNKGSAATEEFKTRFASLARTYIEAKARHAVLVSEWVEVIK